MDAAMKRAEALGRSGASSYTDVWKTIKEITNLFVLTIYFFMYL